MRALGEREGIVQEGGGAPDDRCAAGGVKALAAGDLALVGQHVGAVERVVEAAPAGVGGIERIARVAHRDHELRSGDVRDLGVDVRGGHPEVRTFRDQVADVGQEGAIGAQVLRLAAAAQVPGVDLGLELVAAGEQGAVAGGEAPARSRRRTPRGRPGRRRCPGRSRPSPGHTGAWRPGGRPLPLVRSLSSAPSPAGAGLRLGSQAASGG